ncbi:MAG: ribonuclease D [Isosphaeraceae bacterium]|nr:ribonuclease D [Isosphaeraceae bacterium]
MDDSNGLEPMITSNDRLDELVDHIRAIGRFAFDTEFVSEDTFEPNLCLVQIATDERLAVVDPLAPGLDLSPFWGVVNDSSIELVMHAAGEDLRICRLKTGRVPQRVFDVQIAAGFVGFGYPLSLNNLVHQQLRITLAGGETRTDWRRRPLSAGQMRYALDDVRHLLELHRTLAAELEQRGRTRWAEDEFADFLASIDLRSEEERWRKLPGLNGLNRQGLEAARRLAEWRREEARLSNRPLRHLLRDDLLVAIAKRRPTSRRDLEALRDFNRPHLLSRANEILRIIEAAQSVDPDQLPEPAARHEDGPGLTMIVSLLAATLAQCAAQHQVAVGLVGGSSDIKELIRWHTAGRPADKSPSLATGWRAEICGKILLDVLEGRRSLRVVDPEADVPVAVDLA